MLGRGAHVILIDDPFASMDEALSEATRKKVFLQPRIVVAG